MEGFAGGRHNGLLLKAAFGEPDFALGAYRLLRVFPVLPLLVALAAPNAKKSFVKFF